MISVTNFTFSDSAEHAEQTVARVGLRVKNPTETNVRMVSSSWMFSGKNGIPIGGREAANDWCLIRPGAEMVFSGGGSLPPVPAASRGDIRIHATSTLYAIEECAVEPIPVPGEKQALTIVGRKVTSKHLAPEVGIKIIRSPIKRGEMPHFMLEAVIANATGHLVDPIQLRKRLVGKDGTEIWDTQWSYEQRLAPKGYLACSERATADSKSQLEGATLELTFQIFHPVATFTCEGGWIEGEGGSL